MNSAELQRVLHRAGEAAADAVGSWCRLTRVDHEHTMLTGPHEAILGTVQSHQHSVSLDTYGMLRGTLLLLGSVDVAREAVQSLGSKGSKGSASLEAANIMASAYLNGVSEAAHLTEVQVETRTYLPSPPALNRLPPTVCLELALAGQGLTPQLVCSRHRITGAIGHVDFVWVPASSTLSHLDGLGEVDRELHVGAAR